MRKFAASLLLLMVGAAMATESVTYKIDKDFIQANDPYAIIEPVWWSVSTDVSPEKYKAEMARFTREQQLVFACHWYIAEVNNGGHDQFYYNSTGIVWRDALEGFTAIGQAAVAKLISESAKRMGGSPSLDRNARNETLDRLKPDFADLDKEFYRIQEVSDIEASLLAYIRRQPEKFVYTGTVNR